MSRDKTYRVKVESYVLVNAGSVGAAKAKAEVALRKSVIASHTSDSETRPMWGDDWTGFSFLAKSTEVWKENE